MFSRENPDWQQVTADKGGGSSVLFRSAHRTALRVTIQWDVRVSVLFRSARRTSGVRLKVLRSGKHEQKLWLLFCFSLVSPYLCTETE